MAWLGHEILLLGGGYHQMNSFSKMLGMQGGSFVKVLLASFALCLLALALPGASHAQDLSGMQGTVTDQTGAVVVGATVTVTNDATDVARSVVSSSAGTWTITDLNPGTYTVKVEKPGFQTIVMKGLPVQPGRQSSADASLKPSSVTETVEVSSSNITLETSQPELSTEIENKLVQELPVEIGGVNGGVVQRGRQIDDYLFLAPGVTGGEFSHRINGGLDQQNEVIFNGVVAVQSETQGFQTYINPPFEMVGEFSVVQGTFSAQYGLSQGAALYQFAVGTNQLHGDAVEINRNSYFDAPGAVQDQFGNDQPVPNHQNDYGFSLGGPVWLPHVYNGKDKTFWHFSLEKYRVALGTGPGTVPTTAMKNGDFSNYDAPGTQTQIPIYVPPAWASNPGMIPAGCTIPGFSSPAAAAGQQFPGNVIPSTCISPASQSLLGLLPKPNTGHGDTYFDGSINESPVTVPLTLQTSWGFTIDQNLTSKQAVHASYWRDRASSDEYNGNPAIFNNALSALSYQPTTGTGLFLTYSNAFSNNLVMTAGFGWMGELNFQFNNYPYPGFPGFVSGGLNYLPGISWSDHATAGITGWSQGEDFSINRKLGLAFDNNWLWTSGRHTINFGVDVRRSAQDDHECQNCVGSLGFNNRTTSNGVDQTTTGSAFASFLLGDVDNATRSGAAENKLRNFYFAPYIQDNIKITPKLTVDLGLRWDLAWPFTDETQNAIVFFNPSTQNAGATIPADAVVNPGGSLLGAANLLGTNCSGCSGYNSADMQWRHFSPRFGFAYEFNDQTVILGGFSWSYLDGGAFEYGVNKVAADYGNLLNGVYQNNSNASTIPGYGPPGQPMSWDNYPLPQPPTVPFTPVLLNGTGSAGFFSRDVRQPYDELWNIGIQRKLPHNWFAQASYVGNHDLHLPASLMRLDQLNPSLLAGLCGSNTGASCVLGQPWTSPSAQAVLQSQGFGTFNGLYTPYNQFEATYGDNEALAQALVPYPQYTGIFDGFDTSGAAFYNALQVQVQKRYTTGLSFLAAYTLSQTMSNTDSGFATFNGNGLNEYNTKAEWDVADNDQTHLLSVSFVYELPIGPGKKFLDKGGLLAKNLIGGWQVSGVLSYQSGTPLQLSASGEPGAFGSSPLVYTSGNRPNLVPGVPNVTNWSSAYYSGLCVFAGTCATPPASAYAITTGAFSDPGAWGIGDAPRNPIRGPFADNENIALAKKFFFGERVTGELRMEFYNIFNRFLVPASIDGNVFDSTIQPYGRFGLDCYNSVCQGNSPRTGQATFKLNF
jgi:hypothetical protein